MSDIFVSYKREEQAQARKLADALDAERVEQPRTLLPAVKRALAIRKPVLLDVVCPIEGI